MTASQGNWTFAIADGGSELAGGACASDARAGVPQRKVLVVEDVAELAELLVNHLKTIASDVRVCGNGRAAFAAVQKDTLDLVILDIGLPGMDGLEVCRAIRAAGIPTPILMLSARASELDRIVGLEFGADDYLVKPFSILELLARARAIFRRTERRSVAGAPLPEGDICVGPLRVVPSARQVFRGETPIPMTEKEFDLFLVFAAQPGRVFTRHQLLDLVWGVGVDVYEYSVTSHINRLRAKIETDPANPQIIQTVWGVGYRLQADPVEPELP